jgi:hypothetical protein
MAANKARFEVAVLVQRLASQATIRVDNALANLCTLRDEPISYLCLCIFVSDMALNLNAEQVKVDYKARHRRFRRWRNSEIRHL